MNISIKNRIQDSRSLASNLVYPDEKGYRRVAKLDKNWVKEQLKLNFNVSTIDNKYACDVRGLIVYNHDGNYWLIEKE